MAAPRRSVLFIRSTPLRRLKSRSRSFSNHCVTANRVSQVGFRCYTTPPSFPLFVQRFLYEEEESLEHAASFRILRKIDLEAVAVWIDMGGADPIEKILKVEGIH